MTSYLPQSWCTVFSLHLVTISKMIRNFEKHLNIYETRVFSGFSEKHDHVWSTDWFSDWCWLCKLLIHWSLLLNTRTRKKGPCFDRVDSIIIKLDIITRVKKRHTCTHSHSTFSRPCLSEGAELKAVPQLRSYNTSTFRERLWSAPQPAPAFLFSKRENHPHLFTPF